MTKKIKLLWIFIGIPFALYLIMLVNNLRNFHNMTKTEKIDCESILEKRELDSDYRLCESVKLMPATIRGFILSILVYAVLIRLTRKDKQ